MHYNAHISPSARPGKVDSNNRWIAVADVGNCDLQSVRAWINPLLSYAGTEIRWKFAVCDRIIGFRSSSP